MSRIKNVSQRILSRTLDAVLGRSIPGHFAQDAPSPENMVRLFKNGWASKLPIDGVESGDSGLFDDDRIKWFLSKSGGVVGKSVLELGPLEAGHTYMIERAGARRVVAVEANGRAFLKCLAVKETFCLDRSRFLFGDFLRYLEVCEETFDVAIACGVLYHLRDPQNLFRLLRRACRGPVFLWTMVWSEAIATDHPRLHRNFGRSRKELLPSGKVITLHRHEYRQMFATRFWGGNHSYAEWMSREDVIAAAESAGYKVKEIAFDEPRHPNGPAFALLLVPDECIGV